MLFDPQYTQELFNEHERQVSALLLERAALKARAERSNAMADLAGQGFRLVTGLVATTWRWVQSALLRVHWTLPSPGKPYGQTPHGEKR
jgi:hypothetical protein